MGQATHTPGPWMAYNSDNGRILKHWRIKGGCVRDDPTFAVVDSGGKLLPEYEAANARLIAAAPDLLAALQGAMRHLVTGRGVPDKDKGRTAEQQSALDAAWAAIAKATQS